MTFDDHKKSILQFFNDHVVRYLVTDLKVLDGIKADANGIGGCAIPQAITTFTAIDLFGYLLDTDNVGSNIVALRLKPFLRNKNLFPDIAVVNDVEKFIASFRDDIRSPMAHRFFLMKYDIGKFPENSLFIEVSGRPTFNVSFFTRTVLAAIQRVYDAITADTLQSAGDPSVAETFKRLYDRIETLKTFQSPTYTPTLPALLVTTSTTTNTEATRSIN